MIGNNFLLDFRGCHEQTPFRNFGINFTTLSSLYADDLPPSNQGREATGFVNPSSRFQVDNGWNLFLNTEFLWWVAKEDGLYYAQSGYTEALTSTVPPDGTINFNGHLQRVTPDWSPGFRIGLGGNMAYDEWDISQLDLVQIPCTKFKP